MLNKEVVPFFVDNLTSNAVRFVDIKLLQKLIAQNEALIHEEYVERTRYASRLACFGQSPDEGERLAKHLTETNTASVCSRFLIEFVAALQPQGSENVNDENYDLLLALASEVVNKGFLSDAVHAGISHAELSILPSGRLGISRDSDRYTQALHSMLESMAGTTIDDALESAEDRLAGDADKQDSFAKAEELASVEFGFSFTQLSLFTSELVNLSHEEDPQTDIGLIPVAAATQRMMAKFGWDTEIIDAFFDQLTLLPSQDFWGMGAEVMPWRYNRARSYLRRPLIRWTVDGVDSIIFGHRNTIRTSFELHGQYLSGRLKANTTLMKEALSCARDRKGEEFEKKVEVELRKYCDPVRLRAHKFGSFDLHDINGVNLGDIDLLGYRSASNNLYVIEAKSLVVARTPRELQNEISNLVQGDHSAVARLKGRYEWVLANTTPVLQELGVQVDSVSISPLIIVDADLVSARFDSPYPIVTLRNLDQFFNV